MWDDGEIWDIIMTGLSQVYQWNFDHKQWDTRQNSSEFTTELWCEKSPSEWFKNFLWEEQRLVIMKSKV